MTFRRRVVVAGFAALPLLAAAGQDELAGLERRSGGRLGVAIRDTGSGRTLTWRADERFPMCSTFKLLAAAAILARVDRGEERLDRLVPVRLAGDVGYAPVTRPLAGGRVAIATLCSAAVTVSDNGAANLLLAALGGPAAITRYARTLGDLVTRLDRTEPTLNAADVGDPRDTTTPAAMIDDLDRLLFRHALSPASERLLFTWLFASRTGDQRVRAGAPDLIAAGKTGTSGDSGTSNDVVALWTSTHTQLLVAAYLTRSPLDGAGREAILAEVGRIAARV